MSGGWQIFSLTPAAAISSHRPTAVRQSVCLNQNGHLSVRPSDCSSVWLPIPPPLQQNCCCSNTTDRRNSGIAAVVVALLQLLQTSQNDDSGNRGSNSNKKEAAKSACIKSIVSDDIETVHSDRWYVRTEVTSAAEPTGGLAAKSAPLLSVQPNGSISSNKLSGRRRCRRTNQPTDRLTD